MKNKKDNFLKKKIIYLVKPTKIAKIKIIKITK